jgi:hypothetical protein
MRTILLGIVAVLIAASPAAADRKKQVRYLGVHPIAKAHGGGMCYIEGPHVHVFAGDKLQYRDHGGYQVFVGDPVAHGYDGPRFAYQGHHPVHVHADVQVAAPAPHFCYLDGPHYHAVAPPQGPEFQVVGDVHFYVAEPPAVYLEARPAMVKINAAYKPMAYARPAVVVEPPVGWIGARVSVGGPAVVVDAPAAVVATPGVVVDAHVHVPAPVLRVDVGIGAPGVVVHERRYKGKKHGKWKKHKRRRW